jgi:hypothetical protein
MALAVAVLAATSASSAAPAAEISFDQLAQVQLATAKYRNVSRALADGYAPLSPCVASPAGTMGVHYGKPSLLANPAVNILTPELLLYVPGPVGQADAGRRRVLQGRCGPEPRHGR